MELNNVFLNLITNLFILFLSHGFLKLFSGTPFFTLFFLRLSWCYTPSKIRNAFLSLKTAYVSCSTLFIEIENVNEIEWVCRRNIWAYKNVCWVIKLMFFRHLIKHLYSSVETLCNNKNNVCLLTKTRTRTRLDDIHYCQNLHNPSSMYISECSYFLFSLS